MESLQKRSDGFAETQSGLFGVVPLNYKEDEDGVRFKSFRPGFTNPIIEVNWKGDIAVVEEEVARAFMNYGYAEYPTQDQIEAYNAEYADKPKPKSKPKAKAKAEEKVEDESTTEKGDDYVNSDL